MDNIGQVLKNYVGEINENMTLSEVLNILAKKWSEVGKEIGKSLK